MFGQNNAIRPFGSTVAGFGQQTQPQQTPLFGAGTTPNQFGANTGFGATTTFGNQQQRPAFGGSLFGQQQTGAFGSQPATGLFGSGTATTNATGGLFGSNTAAPAFGQTGGSFGFGGTAAGGGATAAGGLFGSAQQQTGGLFGANPQQAAAGSSLFGATSSAAGSLFSSTPTQQNAGLFGAGSFGGVASGTTTKFNPPSGSDTVVKNGQTSNVQTRHLCITAMKEYEAKSLEELRLEDYAANRKGPQQSAGGLFGNTQTTQAQSSFGGMFSQKPAGFATTFGAATTTSSSLFGTGSTFANKPLFGASTTTTASSSFGGFGGTSTFGGGGVFGQQQQQRPLFGQPTATSGTAPFGQPAASAPAGFGGFGGFGSTAQSQAQPAGGLFAPRPTFGGFGATSSGSSGFSFGQNTSALPAFGKPAATSSGFGGFASTSSTAPFGTSQAGGNLFGTKPPGFGTQTTTAFGAGVPSFGGFGQGTSSLGGLNFGNKPQPAFGSTFPAPAGGNLFSGFPATQSTSLPVTNDAQAASQQALQQQLLTLATHAPYGENPLFQNLKPASKVEDLTKPTNPVAQRAVLTANSPRVSSRPLAKVKPKPARGSSRKKDDLFDGLDEEDVSFGVSLFVPKNSVKRLIINNTSSHRDSLNESGFSNNTSLGGERGSPALIMKPQVIDAASRLHDMSVASSPISSAQKERLYQEPLTKSVDKDKITTTSGHFSPILKSPNNGPDNTIAELNIRNKRFVAPNMSGDQTIISQTDISEEDVDGSERSKSPGVPHATGITLKRPGYYMIPSLDELAAYVDDNGECLAENVVIGREGYGNVMFPGIINVAGLDLDKIVFFKRKEIDMYPNDEMRPPVGEGLNRKAQVTLDCVWPTDKSTRLPIKDENRLAEMDFVGKLERSSAKLGAKFIEYRPETGSWVFEVKHFSKYGLLDDSEDEDDGLLLVDKLKQQQQKQQESQKMQSASLQIGSGTRNNVVAPIDSNFVNVGQKYANSQFQVVPGAAALDHEDTDMPEMSRKQYLDLKDVNVNINMSDDAETEVDVEDEDEMELSQYVESASHRMASGLGIDARSMQLRKISLFGSDEVAVEGYSASRWMFGTAYESPASKSLNKMGGSIEHPSNAYFSRAQGDRLPVPIETSSLIRSQLPRLEQTTFFSQPDSGFVKWAPKEHPLIPSGMKFHEKIAKSAPELRHGPFLVPLSESLLFNRHNHLMDSGLFHGRRFRVGWACQNTLIFQRSAVSNLVAENKKGIEIDSLSFFPSLKATLSGKQAEVSSLKLSVVKINSSLEKKTALSKVLTERWLNIELEESEIIHNKTCPYWKPQKGTSSLERFAAFAKHVTHSDDDEEFFNQSRLVWSLCAALWGDLDIEDNQTPEGRYLIQRERRKAVTQWLIDAVQDKVNEEVESIKNQKSDSACATFSYLTGHQVDKACSWCQNHGDYRLALLVTQSAGSSEERQLIQRQLEHWSQTKADEFISLTRLKVYTLLSGLTMWSGSCRSINICEQLDWKRCFAIYLWYRNASSAPIAKAVEDFEKAFEGSGIEGVCAAYPSPPYREDKHGFVDEGVRGTGPKDACYLLLKLFASPLLSLNSLLDPSAFTADHLDYRLSWHLYCVLTSLGYGQALSDHKVALLSLHYSTQLEAIGLWHWAIFILLHLDQDACRKKQVQDLLARNVTLDDDADELEKEKFVCDVLKVPYSWIHRAKAYRAHVENRYEEEALYLLQAECWNEAHDVVINYLVSESIVNDDCDSLKRHLSLLAANSSLVSDWSVGGRVYLEYLDIIDAVDELKQLNKDTDDMAALLATLSEHQQQQLKDALVSVAHALNDLNCPAPIDRLCQVEMAKKTSSLLHSLTMSVTNGPGSFESLVPVVTRLPLPQDIAIRQLDYLLALYASELSRM